MSQQNGQTTEANRVQQPPIITKSTEVRALQQETVTSSSEHQPTSTTNSTGQEEVDFQIQSTSSDSEEFGYQIVRVQDSNLATSASCFSTSSSTDIVAPVSSTTSKVNFGDQEIPNLNYPNGGTMNPIPGPAPILVDAQTQTERTLFMKAPAVSKKIKIQTIRTLISFRSLSMRTVFLWFWLDLIFISFSNLGDKIHQISKFPMSEVLEYLQYSSAYRVIIRFPMPSATCDRKFSFRVRINQKTIKVRWQCDF